MASREVCRSSLLTKQCLLPPLAGSACAVRRDLTSGHKIGGRSKALGMLTMHEEIVVHVDLMFVVMEPSHQARH